MDDNDNVVKTSLNGMN